MKILKFRFYDKTKKKMKFFNSIWNMLDPDYDFDDIQQFTGLLDKLGKEIYEGDIVKRKSSDGVSETAVAEFRRGRYNIGDYDPTYGWEIIGNIYDNPNLI